MTRIRLPLTLAVAALVACVAVTAAAEDETRLVWKFPPGSVRAYRYELSNEQIFPAMGMKTTSVSMEMTRDRIAPAGGPVGVVWQLERLTVKASLGPGGELEYDSDRPEDKEKAGHQALAGVTPLLGRSIAYAVGETGKLERVAPIEGTPAIRADSLQRRLQGYYPELPDRPLRRGDRWTAREPVAFETLRGGIRDRIYTFEGVSERAGRPAARLIVTDTFGFVPPTDEAAEGGGMMRLASMQGHGKGEIWFLLDEGCILEESFEASMHLQVTVGPLETELQVLEKSSRKLTP